MRDVHGLLGGLGGAPGGVGAAVVVGEVELLAEDVEAVDLVEDVDLGDVGVGAEVVGEARGVGVSEGWKGGFGGVGRGCDVGVVHE